MKLTEQIAALILRMLDEAEGQAEIQRNEMAERLGCVPSQINYVLTSRFTPEQGYLVESRRGGGGFIRITRVPLDHTGMLMHVINCVGSAIDEASCFSILRNLGYQDLIAPQAEALMKAALSDKNYRGIPAALRDQVRANIFKNMLLLAV